MRSSGGEGSRWLLMRGGAESTELVWCELKSSAEPNAML